MSGDRPDCMLVSDDIVVDSVVAGILDAGLRVGEDIDVVAHCNYPLIETRPMAGETAGVAGARRSWMPSLP